MAMSEETENLISLGIALKGGAEVADRYLGTDDGQKFKKTLLKHLRKHKAFKAAALVMETEAALKAVIATAKELEEKS